MPVPWIRHGHETLWCFKVGLCNDPGLLRCSIYRCATANNQGQLSTGNWSLPKRSWTNFWSRPPYMCFFKALLQFVTSEKTRHHGKFTKHPVAGCKFNFIQHAFLNAWVFGHRNVLHPFFFGDDNWNFIASGKKIHLVGGAEGFLGNIHPGSVIVFPIDLSHGVPAISEGEQATQQLATRSPNGTNINYGPTKSTETDPGMIQVEIQIPDGFFWVK